MHSASFRSRYVALAIALTTSCATLVTGNAQTKSAVPVKTITVSEGTNVFVTVSPDHKTIIADLQGLLYSMSIHGGLAKQITTPYQEASHPDWSAKADLIAIQSYAGGTFHICTMHSDGARLKQITSGHGDDRQP